MPDGSQLEFPVETSPLRVGRQPGVDLLLADASVSRAHAVFTVSPQGVFLEDLGSSNGTTIGGVRLAPGQPRLVLPGQVIRMGSFELVLALYSDGIVVDRTAPSSQPQAGIPLEPPPMAPLRGHLEPAFVPARPATPRPTTRRTWLLLGGCALLALVACALLAWIVWTWGRPLLQGLGSDRSQASLGCAQPPLSMLSWGGKVFAPPTSLAPLPTLTSRAPATDQALATDTPLLGATQVTAPVPTAVSLPGEPVLVSDSGFLEMPFPVDGSNAAFGASDDQFRLASQRNTGVNGGRVNSFFDHLFPLYPAPKDPGLPGGSEPADKPIGENILLFNGSLSPYFAYSGHPAYDYSTFEYHKATTPVFAAAAGTIAEVFEHKSGALVVRITHQVAGLGAFQTSYWHLEPDAFFDAMRSRVGQTIAAGERLGTMGNTGYSTGHHLHFEVRFDANGDGIFSSLEVIDPYGWVPSADYPTDPWQKRSSAQSPYLWVHPLGVVAQVAEDGGGALVQDPGRGGAGPDETTPSSQACLPPGSLPPGGRVYWSWSPEPPPGQDDAGVGRGCTLAVFDPAGEPVLSFPQPVKIEIPYAGADLVDVDPASLAIYWRSPGSDDWEKLDTTLFPDQGVAVAFTSTPGTCSLRGEPLSDLVPPQTEIMLSGEQAPDGAFYDRVQVRLEASDNEGVARTEYSLDGGRTWQAYSGPFTVTPEMVIPQPEEQAAENFAGGPGTYLVLAVSVDETGNREEPPAYRAFSIDPSKNPEKPFVPSQPTETPTPKPSPTPGPLTACDHPYLPLRLGSRWEFSTPDGPRVWEVTELGEGKAVVLDKFLENSPDIFAKFTYLCGEQGVLSYLSYLQYPEISDLFRANYELLEQSGATLPPVELMVPGATWTERTVTRMTHSNGPETFTFTIVIQYEVTSAEPVTFDGKVYEALQVSATLTTQVVSDSGITNESAAFEIVMARGVGFIHHDQMDLTAFSIP